tara:strand:+ start:1416 stop:2102 length:687 start_codon:yes stop_codon:yes gene_type:complete
MDDLPMSSRIAYKQFIEAGFPEPVARMQAFLAMEAYMPMGRTEIAKEKTCYCYLSRIVRASRSIDEPIGDSESRAIEYMLGLDALHQLSRIPDILSSPPCLRIYHEAQTALGRECRFTPDSSDLTDMEERCADEGIWTVQRFTKKNQKTHTPTYIDGVRFRYYRWMSCLWHATESPECWQDAAMDALREIHQNPDFAEFELRRDDRKLVTYIRPLSEFYMARFLEIKI